MRVPISWLKEYVDLNLPTKQLADRITLAGLTVEGIEPIGEWWDPELIVVGQVVAVKAHPNADRLVLVDVDYGGFPPAGVASNAPDHAEDKKNKKITLLNTVVLPPPLAPVLCPRTPP